RRTLGCPEKKGTNGPRVTRLGGQSVSFRQRHLRVAACPPSLRGPAQTSSHHPHGLAEKPRRCWPGTCDQAPIVPRARRVPTESGAHAAARLAVPTILEGDSSRADVGDDGGHHRPSRRPTSSSNG